MTIPRRQRLLRGRFAKVDAIPFEMPIDSRDTNALMALFSIDGRAAEDLVAGEEVHAFHLLNGRGVLVITVVNYTNTDIGAYVEFSIAIACTHGFRRPPRMLPALLRKTFGTGQYVVDLPVSTEVSVKGGKGIWGMPKHRASLDFTIGDDQVSSQYDLDDELAMRIEIDRPRGISLPLNIGAVNYCSFRGLLMKSSVYFKGTAQLRAARGMKDAARLYIGPHPRMDPLRDLDVDPDPIATAFLSHTYGVLDDHFEGWFETYGRPPAATPEGLESVVDLGESQTWLPPPTAPYREYLVGGSPPVRSRT
ncbi:MAG TPA: acetoacetate decarboxylase family protein [Actinomycetota bacterium]|nr:acetoacetate decarboxylase family protein [Actinomycetota bacterium]